MPTWDVFLSHSHADAERVEQLAKRLEDEERLKPWLDRWEIVPGSSWQQAIAKGLEETGCCAICLGTKQPEGWFQKECEAALNRQAGDQNFGVVAVLLPGASENLVSIFLKTNDWIDLRANDPTGEMFYRLVCGIRKVKPGRYTPKSTTSPEYGLTLSVSPLEQALELINSAEKNGRLTREEAIRSRDLAVKAYLKTVFPRRG